MVLRISRWLLLTLGWLAAAIGIALAATGLRLTQGPISLTWLTPSVERLLSEPGVRIASIDDTQLRLGDEKMLEFAAVGVRGHSLDGDLIYELAEIEFEPSLMAFLEQQVFAARRLTAHAPRLVIVRNEEGQIDFGTGAPSAPGGSDPQGFNLGVVLGVLIEAADAARPEFYIEQLVMTGGELVFEDLSSGEVLTADNANLEIDRSRDRVEAALTFELASTDAADDRTTFAIRSQSAPDLASATFTADVEGLDPGRLQPLLPEVPLDRIDLEVDGRLSGVFSPTDGFGPLAFEARSSGGAIAWPGLFPEPIVAGDIAVGGELAADFGELRLDQITLDLGPKVTGDGGVAWRTGELTLDAELEVADLAADDLGRYWPPQAAPEARKWVLANIRDGRVSQSMIQLRFEPGDLAQRPPPEHVVSGWFDFEDLTAGIYETMPALTGLHGRSVFSARRMDFTVAGGALETITVEGGRVMISGMGLPGRDTTQLLIEARATGPLGDSLAILDRPPLGYAADIGIDPSTAAGRAVADLEIGIPLHRDLDTDEISVAAQVRLADLAGVVHGVDVREGRFDLEVDQVGLDLIGEGVIEGMPLAIKIRDNFEPDAPFETSFEATGRVMASEIEAALGDDGYVENLEGSFELDLQLVQTAGDSEVELAVDFADLGAAIPAMNWSKPRAKAGKLDASITIPSDGLVTIQNLHLVGPDARVLGMIIVDPVSGSLHRARIDRIRFGDTDATLAVEPLAEDGGYRLTVDARSLDLTPSVRSNVRQGPAPTDRPTGPPIPLEIDLRAARMVFEETQLTDVDARLIRDSGGWRQGTITGLLEGGAAARLTLEPAPDHVALRLTAADAGDLLQTFDRTSRIEGGRLTLETKLTGQVPALEAEGELKVRDFTVLEAPLLARLLAVASLDGIGNLLGGGTGIRFDRLKVPFALRDRTLTIDGGRLNGSQVGMTVDGTVIFADDQRLDLQGTVVPLYGLNHVIGKIPLLGNFLAGSDGEGAFAVTYSAVGPASEVAISVNPLSILAPGMLRDLFDYVTESDPEPGPDAEG